MTDIVEWLRDRSQGLTCFPPDALMDMAADKIERLRKRVSELESAIEKEYMDDAKELAESAITKSPQEQAFNIWGESKGSFGFDYLEVWNAACAWQREQDARICKDIGNEYMEEGPDDFGYGCFACAGAIEESKS